ncbi:MAG: hypothetical protein ABSG13_23675 [Bryobacteraceae bacterium]
MAAIPPTYSSSGVAEGGLTVEQIFPSSSFTAPGVDYTYTQIVDAILIGQVAFQ